jgi:hypothetical protein
MSAGQIRNEQANACPSQKAPNEHQQNSGTRRDLVGSRTSDPDLLRDREMGVLGRYGM